MGQVSSRTEDSPQIYLRDHSRCTAQISVQREKLISLVALQAIRVVDAHDNEVLSVNVQNGPGSKVIASNESKRPIEFIQVPILADLNVH